MVQHIIDFHEELADGAEMRRKKIDFHEDAGELLSQSTAARKLACLIMFAKYPCYASNTVFQTSTIFVWKAQEAIRVGAIKNQAQ